MNHQKMDVLILNNNKSDNFTTVGTSPHNVSCSVKWLGDDMVLHVYGGQVPHVGAVAVASPRPSLKDPSVVSASASVITLLGHKEDELARSLALELSAFFSCKVVVVAGIHMESARGVDIEQINANIDEAVSIIKQGVKTKEPVVILVDENNHEIGYAKKLEAHKRPLLHRAFSVFIFNSKQELLIQRRAMSKYHSPGLWSNTCCSHPEPGQVLIEGAQLRLMKEMGFTTTLRKAGELIYKTEFDNGLMEHEYVHLLVGSWDGTPQINREEADDFEWILLDNLKRDVVEHPSRYTYWFPIALEQLCCSLLNGER